MQNYGLIAQSGVVRTIYASHLTNCKTLERPFSLLPNSTINQNFGLNENEGLGVNQLPKLGYICIGNKGCTYELTEDNSLLTNPVPHLPRHANLYNYIPFLVRPTNNDISSQERLKYRMRVPFTKDGVSYVAYYLRVLPLDDVIPSVELRNVTAGSITSDPFVPTLSDLRPSHPRISNTNLNTPDGDYLVATAKVDFVLNQQEVMNIIDACTIMFGDPRYAVINEIGLATGVDKVVQGTFGGTQSSYTDVIAAQIAAFIYQYHSITPMTTEIRIALDIGSVTPLLS